MWGKPTTLALLFFTIRVGFKFKCNPATDWIIVGICGTSFLTLSSDNFAVDCIKVAQDGRGVIVRIAEEERRRGKAKLTWKLGGKQVVEADIPMSGLYGYCTDLRSMTGGIGEFAYEFKGWSDLRRQYTKSELETFMKNVNNATEYSNTDYYLPIPHAQYLLNPTGLWQNPGYNE